MNEKIYLSGKIVFIASMEDLHSSISNSTHIMTRSILEGLKENGQDIIFIPIVDSGKNKDRIQAAFSGIASKTICIDSFFGYNLNKFRRMFVLLLSVFFRKKQKKVLSEFLSRCIGTPKMIICHYPSLETTVYGDLLKKRFRKVQYYLYGSDPIALSGIIPEQFGIKRWPFYFVEKNSYKKPDRIIFGTQPLMFFQKQLYKRYAAKMRYIDVAGAAVERKSSEDQFDEKHLLYSGNYYKHIRNIEPLMKAISETDFVLDVYGSGDVSTDAENIHIHGRISAEEIKKVESRYRTLVCILNQSCIQIPGKIFYSMMSDSKIIVILDGPYKTVIKDYLDGFKRFITCENDKDSILHALRSVNVFSVDWDHLKLNYSNEKVTFDLINGGNISDEGTGNQHC